MDQDSMTCWLRSVEEAKEEQRMFRDRLATVAKRFFIPKRRLNTSSCGQLVTGNVGTPEEREMQGSSNIRLGPEKNRESQYPDPQSPVPPDPPLPP
jgi:hypothetical protein